MLNLKSKSPTRWLDQVETHLDEVLIDHAHCERKAAGNAMNLIFAYVDNEELCRAMTVIVNEELEHFHLVLELLRQRGIPFRRNKPTQYGRRLNDLVRKSEPVRAIDRLLVAALIEARSCERFGLLHENLTDRGLADFYGSLSETEARHHTIYLRLAGMYGAEDEVCQRLDDLAAEEAKIIKSGDVLPRMHS